MVGRPVSEVLVEGKFALSADEWRLAEEAAAKRGLTLAQFVREEVVKAARSLTRERP